MNKFVLVLSLLISAGRLAAQAGQKLVVHLSEPGKLFKLNINLNRAAIKVTGYDGKDVIIDVEAKESNDREKIDLTARENHNEVTVEEQHEKAINLDVKVPKTMGIFKLSSASGGTIVVSDVNGNLELQNKSGGISALNVSGSVVAGTLSGKITVSFKSVDPEAAMAFSTVSGSIDVSFPASLKANLKIKSDLGKVYSDFGLAADPGHPIAVRDEKDGVYHLSIDDWIYGRVGGGGQELLFKITNGNIHIYKVN